MTGPDKLAEEIGELKPAIAEGALKAKQLDEPDPVLFVYANLPRHLELDPGLFELKHTLGLVARDDHAHDQRAVRLKVATQHLFWNFQLTR